MERPLYLLYGDEPALLFAWKKRLLSFLSSNDNMIDRIDGQKLDLSTLYDLCGLTPMLGGRRIVVVDDFDITSLSEGDLKDLTEIVKGLFGNVSLVLSAKPETIDVKKNKKSAKFIDACDKTGIVAEITLPDDATLKKQLAAYCKKLGCELSPQAAGQLIEHCGSDLGLLLNECQKLCAYSNGGEITFDMIISVCSKTIEGDIYALFKLIVQGNTTGLLKEIDSLMSLHHPVAMLLSNLGSSFCDLARACAARSSGHTADNMADDFSYKFRWRAQNAFRDCSKFSSENIFSACEIIAEADSRLKSSQPDERVLLEHTAIRLISVLRGDLPC